MQKSTRFAFLRWPLATSIPSCSKAPGEGRIPAVSTIRKGNPSREIEASSASRVVPGISDTIARCWPSNLLYRLDLPEFGGPANTTSAPSFKSSPSGAVSRSFVNTCLMCPAFSMISAKLTGPSSSSGKSMWLAREACSSIISFLTPSIALVSPFSS